MKHTGATPGWGLVYPIAGGWTSAAMSYPRIAIAIEKKEPAKVHLNQIRKSTMKSTSVNPKHTTLHLNPRIRNAF